MFQFADLQLFVRVAAVGSMSEVARQMDLTPAAASATVKRLEAALEARLFERSTRSLRLTPAGETFLGYCEQALSLIDEGRARLRSGVQEVAGPLRLGASSDLGRGVLPPVLDDF
ncbi:MAG: LysR family transcriptional regulator, partial [Aquabacterium sp.]